MQGMTSSGVVIARGKSKSKRRTNTRRRLLRARREQGRKGGVIPDA